MEEENEKTVIDFSEKVKDQMLSYFDVKIELLKAQWVEKMALVFSKMITGIIILILSFFTVLFGSLVAGFYFSEIFGSVLKGFGLIALFYALLLVLVLVFKNQIIQIPVVNAIISIIYQDDEK
jgi:hypothetical protein